MPVVTMLMLPAVVLVLWAASGAQGGIVNQSGIQYIKTGDRLMLVCEQLSSNGSLSMTVVWSKATMSKYHQLTTTDINPLEKEEINQPQLTPVPLDSELSYQTIDTTGRSAPYTITQRTLSSDATDRAGMVKLVSELIKDDVTTADSGFYRCRLGIGGKSSRKLVVVIDITTKNARLERVYNNTQLECVITDLDGVTNYSVTWYKHSNEGDTEVLAMAKYLPSGRAKYEVAQRNDGTSVLTVRRAADDDVGLYRCGTTLGTGDARTTIKQDVHLYAYPHVRHFQQSRNVVEGRSLDLVCQAWGWPTPQVTWYRGQTELNNTVDSRVKLNAYSGMTNAQLTIDDIGSVPGDRGHYTCVASSTHEDRNYYYDGKNATVFVRVKDRMAALWPLLGIAVEAIILLVIITSYEMKRNTLTSGADEPASLPNADQSQKSNNSTAGNSHHTTAAKDEHVSCRKNN